MTYSEAIQYIHSRLRFGIRPGLSPIRRLLSLLGNPHEGLVVVHVAGTNGKGSTCAMLEAVLTAAGYKTGAYYSPYILNFRDRIQIGGVMIGEEALAGLVTRIRPLVERMEAEGEVVTEFELITALAFRYFFESGCDRIVLETGLGGRLDATNVVVCPKAAVITSISLDHTGVLGDSIKDIAYEKCGIIKEGCPCVSAPGQEPEALEVIQNTCAQRNSLLCIPDETKRTVLSATLNGSSFLYQNEKFFVKMPGTFQLRNAVTAIECARVLGVETSAIGAGLEKAFLPARMEVLSQSPFILLDGAHNPAGAAQLCRTLKELWPCKDAVAVMGMMKDKDCAGVAAILAPLFDRVYTCAPQNPRAMPARALAQIIERAGGTAMPCDTPEQALGRALESMSGEEGLVICGSFYLASELRGCICD